MARSVAHRRTAGTTGHRRTAGAAGAAGHVEPTDLAPIVPLPPTALDRAVQDHPSNPSGLHLVTPRPTSPRPDDAA